MIAAIVAVDKQWGIGIDGKLLVSIPADMKHFREITKNSIIIMGRKTWDSLPKKTLPNRINYVISRQQIFSDNKDVKFISLSDAYDLLHNKTKRDIFIIGGGTIYLQLLDLCDTVYLTKINEEYEADTFFHNIDKDMAWEIVEDSGYIQDENTPQYRFITYKRKEILRC